MVIEIDKENGKRVIDYEKEMRRRKRMLNDGRNEDKWMEEIEKKMDEMGKEIEEESEKEMRMIEEMIERIKEEGKFKKEDWFMEGEMERRIGVEEEIDIEEDFRSKMRDGREREREEGRKIDGKNRNEMIVKKRKK